MKAGLPEVAVDYTVKACVQTMCPVASYTMLHLV